MYSYSLEQWEIFFFVYSFIGWIYETVLYSVRNRRFVNRGFVYGPVLPIYGFGAVIIMHGVSPISGSPVLVFLVGMLLATMLEYFTGAGMLAMFHVRYWDYSDKFMNLDGQICLQASIIWGIASVLLMYFVHEPLEGLMLSLDTRAVYTAAHVITACFIADFAISFREAMDLRRILDKLVADTEELARLSAEIRMRKKELDEYVAKVKENAHNDAEKLKAAVEAQKLKLETKAERSRTQLEENIEKIRADFAQRNEKMHESLKLFYDSAAYRRIHAIARRNRIAASKRYREALERLREKFDKETK